MDTAQKEHGVAGALLSAFTNLPGIFNPADKQSPISVTRQGISEGTHKMDEAFDEVLPKPIASGMKFVTAFSMAPAEGNPLLLIGDIHDTAKCIQERGIIETGRLAVDGAINNPERTLGGLTFAALTGRVQLQTRGSQSMQLLAGNPDGIQLSLNAYMNNAKIADLMPGLGFNILDEGKRIWGVELHRFNLKGQTIKGAGAVAKGKSVVRIHRHSGPTPSQISKHRKLFGNETY